MHLRREWLSDNRDKTAKGVPFRRMSEAGRVVFRKGCPHAERLIEQVVKFPNGSHDDGYDTLANICRAMTERPAAFRIVDEDVPRIDRRYRTRARGESWRAV